MKRLLAMSLFLGLAVALNCATATAADYYVTDDGGYVYDTDTTWYTTAPSDTYGYYDSRHVYVTRDPHYNSWYGTSGVGVGLSVNIGGDRDRNYWRGRSFDRNYRGNYRSGYNSNNYRNSTPSRSYNNDNRNRNGRR